MSRRVPFLAALLIGLNVQAICQPGLPPGLIRLRIDRDLEYASIGNRSLKLDLYLRECSAPPCTDVPSPSEPAPVVVWYGPSACDHPSSW
jgi:hypothetical protein